MKRQVAITILAAALVACATREPETEAAPVDPSETVAVDRGIDASALVEHVRVLAADSMEGRALGTPGNERARQYLVAQFRTLGLRPPDGGYERPFPANEGATRGVNLVGVVPGTEDPDVYLVVTAHYDHLGVRDGNVFNGADDNASGTAGLIVLAEHFRRHPLRHSLLFAALDGEEGGLRGARAFVSTPPVPLAQIVMNVNLDMVSQSDSVLYVAGTYHYPFLRAHVEAVTPAPPVVLRLGHDVPGTGSDDWTQASDHGPFHEVGIPFLYFGVEDHPHYHQATDTFETIRPGFFAGAIRTVRQVLERVDPHLGDIRTASGRE